MQGTAQTMRRRAVSPRPLLPMQERFCMEYLLDLNGTQAVIRAGYSPRSATNLASNLMALPAVQDRIASLKAERAKRTEFGADEVISN